MVVPWQSFDTPILAWPPGLPRNNLNNRWDVYYEDDVIIKNQGCVSNICISFSFEQGEWNMSWPNTQDCCWMTIQLILESCWRHCSRVNVIFLPSWSFNTPILAWQWSPWILTRHLNCRIWFCLWQVTPDLCNLTREGFKFNQSSPKAASSGIMSMHVYKSIAAKTCVWCRR